MSMNEDPNMLFKTWREKLMDYIDDADKYGVHTYTCSTAPETAEKVLQGSPFDSISDGKVILVAFASDNTAEAPTIDMGLFFGPASLPPAAVKAADGGDITPSALGAGFRMLAYDYNNNMFRLLNPAGGESGTTGVDGGYYAPSVDSDGNLTWTASRAGMPQVSGANIKGPKGVGIASIARTSGTGAAGTTDTYTITLTDGSTSTFTVYNGKDGASGSGSSTVTSVNGQTGDVKLPVSGFGTCATAAATAIKVVDGLPEDFLVEDGVQLCVKFSNANTAAAPQLSVAGASAPIFDARTSNNVDAAGLGARTHHFVYFAGIWVLLDPANASGTVEIDTTLSVSGKAADAKAAGDAISALSEKIGDLANLDTDDKSSIVAAINELLANGGGSGGGSISHSIIWDLVNVTSSNNAVSVSDGASLVAVLSPADGYTLGDVTVTMGGEVVTGAWNAETATIAIASVAGDVVISCTGVEQGTTEIVDAPIEVKFVGGNFTGSNGSFPTGSSAARISHVDLIDGTTKNVKFVHTVPSDGLSNTDQTQFRIFLFDSDGNFVSNWNLDGTTDTTDAWRTTALDGKEYIIPAGYKIRFVFGQGNSNWVNNNAMLTWANTEFKVYYTEEAAVDPDSGETEPKTTEETSVMMLSFNRAYVDTGEYTEDLVPKWDGMFSIHRGYSTAPDNTLQAIWEAKKHGYNCCELDVRYSSDNYPVLCHAAAVTGTVDGESVTYAVAETPLATLLTVCVGNAAFPDAKVCSLEDAMRLCRRIGMRPEIDYKISNEQLYRDCVAMSMKYGLQDDTLHCCYGISYAVIVKTAYEKANLRVDGSLLDSDTSLDEFLSKPGNLYAFYSAAACGKTDGSNVGANVENETRILANKAKGYKMYVWNVTPFLLPDVMQWEPDILQPQSSKDTSDFYSLIRELNNFEGLVF